MPPVPSPQTDPANDHSANAVTGPVDPPIYAELAATYLDDDLAETEQAVTG